jgi:geranylgeranyl diphosphate synthase type II
LTKARYPEDKRELAEAALHRFFPKEDKYPEVIYKAMHHSLFTGGKRFRPILTLLVAEAFGADVNKILPTACAIEYIHTYSLIHDDLPAIDNDDLRRGKPTCHVLFGEDIAILAGDALFAEAFYLIASAQNTTNPSQIVQVINELALASGVRGMVGGQVVDIQSSSKKVDSKTLNFIHTHKTGQLITAAARAGAILAGASGSDLEKVTQFSYYLGLAFQITDDILDVIGDTDVLGKKVGSDEQHNKATFPSVFGLEKAKEKAEEAVKNAINALAGLNIDTESLIELAQFVYERKH